MSGLSCGEMYLNKRQEAQQTIQDIEHQIELININGQPDDAVQALHDDNEARPNCCASIVGTSVNTLQFNLNAFYYHTRYCLNQSRIGRAAVHPSRLPKRLSHYISLCSRSILAVLASYPIGFLIHNGLSFGHSIHDAWQYSFVNTADMWLTQSKHLTARITSGFIGFGLTIPVWLTFITLRVLYELIPSIGNQHQYNYHQATRLPSRYKAFSQHPHLKYIAHSLLILSSLAMLGVAYFKSPLKPNFLNYIIASTPLWPLIIGRNLGFAKYTQVNLIMNSVGMERTAIQGFERSLFSNSTLWPLDIPAIPGSVIGAIVALFQHNFYVARGLYHDYTETAFPDRIQRSNFVSDKIKATPCRNFFGLPGIGIGHILGAGAYIASSCYHSREAHTFYMEQARHLGKSEKATFNVDVDDMESKASEVSEMSDASFISISNSNWTRHSSHHSPSRTGSRRSRRSSRSRLAGSILPPPGQALQTIDSGSDTSDDESTGRPIPRCIDKAANILGLITSAIPSTCIASKAMFSVTHDEFIYPLRDLLSLPKSSQYHPEQKTYLKSWRAKPGCIIGTITGFISQQLCVMAWGAREAWHFCSTPQGHDEYVRQQFFSDSRGFGSERHNQFRKYTTCAYYTGRVIAFIPAYLGSISGETIRAIGTAGSWGFNAGSCQRDHRYRVAFTSYMKSKEATVKFPAIVLAGLTVAIPTVILGGLSGVTYRATCLNACAKAQQQRRAAIEQTRIAAFRQHNIDQANRNKHKETKKTQPLTWAMCHSEKNPIKKRAMRKKLIEQGAANAV